MGRLRSRWWASYKPRGPRPGRPQSPAGGAVTPTAMSARPARKCGGGGAVRGGEGTPHSRRYRGHALQGAMRLAAQYASRPRASGHNLPAASHLAAHAAGASGPRQSVLLGGGGWWRRWRWVVAAGGRGGGGACSDRRGRSTVRWGSCRGGGDTPCRMGPRLSKCAQHFLKICDYL